MFAVFRERCSFLRGVWTHWLLPHCFQNKLDQIFYQYRTRSLRCDEEFPHTSQLHPIHKRNRHLLPHWYYWLSLGVECPEESRKEHQITHQSEGKSWYFLSKSKNICWSFHLRNCLRNIQGMNLPSCYPNVIPLLYIWYFIRLYNSTNTKNINLLHVFCWLQLVINCKVNEIENK